MAGSPPLSLSTLGGTGDADLYVRFGSPPTQTQFDASSANPGDQESVTIAAPKAGTYYIGLRARAPYTGVTLRNGAGPAVCFPGDTSLCLNGGRFKVEVAWRTADGQSGPGHAVSLTGDTGYFWFFDASNVEVVLKVLDACGLNQKFWIFAGGLTNVQVDLTVTDTRTGTVKTYRNTQGTPFQPIQDTGAFSTCNASAVAGASDVEAAAASAAQDVERIVAAVANCAPSSTNLCLSGGRFKVEVAWKTPDGQSRRRPGGRPDAGHGLLLVLQRLERGDGAQGAERLRLQQPFLGLRRRAHQRAGDRHRHGYGERHGDDLHESPGDLVPADPGLVGVRYVPVGLSWPLSLPDGSTAGFPAPLPLRDLLRRGVIRNWTRRSFPGPILPLATERTRRAISVPWASVASSCCVTSWRSAASCSGGP